MRRTTNKFKFIPPFILCLVLAGGVFTACNDDDDGVKRGFYEAVMYLDSAQVLTIEQIVKDENLAHPTIHCSSPAVEIERTRKGVYEIRPKEVGTAQIIIHDEQVEYAISLSVVTEGSDVHVWSMIGVDSLIECDETIKQDILADLSERNVFAGVSPKGVSRSYVLKDVSIYPSEHDFLEFYRLQPDLAMLYLWGAYDGEEKDEERELHFSYEPEEPHYCFRQQQEDGSEKETRLSFQLIRKKFNDYYQYSDGRNAYAKDGVFRYDMTNHYQQLYGEDKVKQVVVEYRVMSYQPTWAD